MNVSRSYFSTSIFSNNKILATGGDSPVIFNSAEIYDLGNNTWENTTPMLGYRTIHHLITLNNGEVIAIGGFLLQSCEIFNPASNSWRYTDSLETLKYFWDTATLLNDGRILVVGGYYFDQPSLQNIHFKICEIFDPISETWSFADSLTDGRSAHTATLLKDGKVIVTGGQNTGDLSSCEIYDPVTNQWSSAGNLLHARSFHSAVLLSDGRVLVSGGVTPDSTLGTRYCEIYDPVTNSWSEAGEMIVPRADHKSLLLLDSTVLITGGSFEPEVWEIYDPKTLSVIYFDTLPVIVFEPELEPFPDGRIISIGGYTFDGMAVENSNQCLMYTPRVTSVNEGRTFVADYSLSQNYPNPFNPRTTIKYQIPSAGNVTLKVYDILGNEIATLVNEEKPAGSYEVEFSATGGGRELASGIYIYRLTVGSPSASSGRGFTASKKLILLK
jgi:Kelch motif/Secretion system C-terminal sorting domain